MMTLAAFSTSYLIARTADQGLANFLALATLRHGTNPLSWIGIHMLGAAPVMGGNRIGGDAGLGYETQNQNRFYFVMDSAYFREYKFRKSHMRPSIQCRQMAQGYTFSILNLIRILSFNQIPSIQTIVRTQKGAALLQLAKIPLIPTIKFRFQTNKVTSQFILDSTIHPPLSCSTSQWQSPLNIGLIGTLWNGLSLCTIAQMRRSPSKVLDGIAKIALATIAATLLISYAPAFVASHKTAMIAGSLLAII